MKKYIIKETLIRIVEAESLEEVENNYKNEDIVLDYNDFEDYEIKEIEEYE